MQSKYPNLFWSLSLNEKLKSELFDTYKNRDNYLFKLDSLINDLKKYECKKIQHTIKDADNLSKFHSTVSELEMGKYLAGNGMDVTFLPDDYLNKNKTSPDILCINKYFNSYVEVTRLSENEMILKIIDLLRDSLKNLPYRVDAILKSELSLPKLRGEERTIQDKLVSKSLEQFDDNIKTNILDFPFEIETDGVIFKVHQVDSDKGYPGIVESEVIEVPTEDLNEYVKERLIEKAKKREKEDGFVEKHREYLYVIALDCETRFIDELDIDLLLYGQKHGLGTNTLNLPAKVFEQWKQNEWNLIVSKVKNDPVWKKIEMAREKDWGDFLFKKYIIPNNYIHRNKNGIFISEQSMDNVSGVLFKENDNIIFYPNPFCSAEINHQKIQSIF